MVAPLSTITCPSHAHHALLFFGWANYGQTKIKGDPMFRFQSRGKKPPHIQSMGDESSLNELSDLSQALAFFESSVGVSDDYVIRETMVMNKSAKILFLETLSDPQSIEETLRRIYEHTFPDDLSQPLDQYLMGKVLISLHTTCENDLNALAESIASGHHVLLIEDLSQALILGDKKVEHRQPEQPNLELSVRGKQIGFVENLSTNISLIRDSLHTTSLVVKKLKVGSRSQCEVAVVYIRDIAPQIVIDTVMERIEAIQTDVINGGADIEHYIVDHMWSIFPLTRNTQSIDSTVRELNQGKVSILVDGDPSTLLVPATVIDFFQSSEDYVHTFFESTYIRMLRIISFFIGLFLPALYIAFVDFNPEMLPKILGFEIARSRETVPFPAFIEVIIMQFVIEILREATLRMPKQMGQTIGVVGGVVLGEAAVQAGIVSHILIIVISLAAISIFVTPSYEFALVLRSLTWLMIACASFIGMYGIVAATMFLLFEVSALRTFGIPYMDPFGGDHLRDIFIDGIIRLPLNLVKRRTSHLHPVDTTRQAGIKALKRTRL